MKTPLPIRSIQKGSDKCLWFRVGENNVASIREEMKPISWGNNTSYEILVYRCFDKDDNLIYEIESDSSLAVFYGSVQNKENFPLKQNFKYFSITL